MNHQEKQLIFDEYAKSWGYEDFDDLLNFDCNTSSGRQAIIWHIFAACDFVQAEQQKRIAGNAKLKSIPAGAGVCHEIDKETIINPENIIS